MRSEKPPAKGDAEVEYWRGRRKVEGELSGPHYRRLYTELFGLEASFFADRRVLDVGCGPRGSLEWATGECRVGLDPLAERYAELGITEHGMRYVTAAAEAMPFRNGAFDIVTSLNSLDHVDDLDAAITELARVIGPDGTLLVITETRTVASPTEPTIFGFDVVDRFPKSLTLVDSHAFEKRNQLVHASAIAAVPYDFSDPTVRPGILKARFVSA